MDRRRIGGQRIGLQRIELRRIELQRIELQRIRLPFDARYLQLTAEHLPALTSRGRQGEGGVLP